MQIPHPELEPQAMKWQRPGELGPEALSVINDSPFYRQMANVPYEQSFTNQDQINTTRRRHLDLLLRGLKDEEGER